MEGDGPTGCMVIPEYVELRHKLQEKVDTLSTSDAVYPMLAKMLQKTQEYLDEALGCESLVVATLLHPLFRMKFFVKWFGGKTAAIPMKAEATLRQLYSDYESASSRHQSCTQSQTTSASSSNPSAERPKMFHDDSDSDEDQDEIIDNSLENYLRMSDKMRSTDYNLEDPRSGLEWWSVRMILFFMVFSKLY